MKCILLYIAALINELTFSSIIILESFYVTFMGIFVLLVCCWANERGFSSGLAVVPVGRLAPGYQSGRG